MAMVDIPGGRICYESNGQGRPLVLLLPQSTGPAGRRELIETLAQQHTVITYDQRGTGGSSAAPKSLSMAAQAADVSALLDALRIERTSVLCHSTGCGIGLSLAVAHPGRIDALVLASPWTWADAHLTCMQNLRIAAARALDPLQYARFNAALLFPPEFRRADEAGFERLAAAAVAHPQDTDEIARRLHAILDFDARALLPTIQIPTLVAVAKDDQLMPAWFAEEAAAVIQGARLLEFDAGGHMLPETRCADFAAAVLAFLGQSVQTS